ncbi:MAG TPA: bifunctional diaminohydroxyphosphoribosylaminopyrimidine deaminase/5-amino-6-(5-phosphoribosylamino)uracil reductase RibD [Actinomycetes bacterium]|nr:bifunctional diaminohydroxyphosphoribosylaminopyrimidine deaminase/5-amino-6-(5-phosphoribosylamino)uracil reductase RibD [Actinomycetes bacterium]
MAGDRRRDEAWMARAVALAEGGRGTTGPNPMVGAVLVRDGRVVGEGFHLAAGQPHAETLALAAAGPLAAGATCYVTLEPCAHHGRTPPCVDALLAAGVARVVVAVSDPDPRVAGAGLARLGAAGVQVTVGAGAEAAADQNAAYLTHRRLGRPRITLKAAASLDGKVAAQDGTSQWITGPAARSDAHRLRAEADAVCVGAGTALADDPRLTVRLDGYAGRQPLRVLVDAAGRVGADGHLFDGEAPTLVATTATAPAAALDAWKAAGAEVLVCPPAGRPGSRGPGRRGPGNPKGVPRSVGALATPRVDRGVDLGHLTGLLGERGALELLVEGGPRLQASFWAAGLADRLIWYLAPLAIGGDGAPGLLGGDGAATLAAAGRLRLASVDRLGDDLRLVAYPRPTGEAASAPPDPPRPELAERGR